MDIFPNGFRDELETLMRLRRDVRHFREDPVADADLEVIFNAARLAPSVGLSEPWRFVRVDTAEKRKAVRDNFQTTNAEALQGYNGEKAEMYAGLKLSGMDKAPVQLAVFCDEETEQGSGLGAGTMPEMRRYSVVAAICNMWLAGRAAGLGLGWVSILDPVKLGVDLDVPTSWKLVAYLCIGYPETFFEKPELEKVGWEERAKKLVPVKTV